MSSNLRFSPAVLALALAAVACAACGGAAMTAQHPDAPATAVSAAPVTDVGFIVAAPDRGFLGNEEIADAVATLAPARNAAVLHVSDDRTAEDLTAALRTVAARGARRAVVLPLFVLDGEAGMVRLEALVGRGGWEMPVTLGRPLGQSYLAVEMLADRLRQVEAPAGRRLVVVGHGAPDAEARTAATVELRSLAERAAAGFGFAAVDAVVWLDRDAIGRGGRDEVAEKALAASIAAGERPVVVPFQLGAKLDGHMSFIAALRMQLGATELVDTDVTPDPLLATWMAREANRSLPVTAASTGIVFLAHGSDMHWNQGMRDAVASLGRRYTIEFAFCMADQPVLERAIRRLEQRGVRNVVIVRVFGLPSSFEQTIEQMFGLDIEAARPAAGHDMHAMHGAGAHGAHAGHGTTATSAHAGHDMHAMHGGHGHGAGGPRPRIRTTAVTTSVGGLGDHPFFAEALLDRALALSKDPAHETVILVAHGSGDDATNDIWKETLRSLARRMATGRGAGFRAIEIGTWREDWPDKRAPELAAIRALVTAAAKDGGTAIVIPARTTAQGSETEFLDGLPHVLGAGFAPHPLFERWVEEQIQAGFALLGAPAPASASASR